MNDLFKNNNKNTKLSETYDASSIEVLEGLEPVRHRPGMYIGGSDENAMHHLINEVFDNAMDEAVAGYASRIEVEVAENNTITISDNGRGIPVDAHPKFKNKSALEVIFTMLHSGGKFTGKAYETSGGLHGVGISVVNALSEFLEVEVAREQKLYRQNYSRGIPESKLKNVGEVKNRRGTKVTFRPDTQIFGEKAKFRPARIYKLIRSKAYLFKGVEIRWKCAEGLLPDDSGIPLTDTIHFPGGIKDYLEAELNGRNLVTSEMFFGEAELADKMGRVEWAVAWPLDQEGLNSSYCNTIYTAEGGTHESGFRTMLGKAVKAYAEMIGNKKAAQIIADDVIGGAVVIISLFIKDPQFQGQTKEKLVSQNATRLIENAVRDHCDHWLSDHKEDSEKLLDYIISRAEERQKRLQKSVDRKAATQRLRLPGKLADCSRHAAIGTEIFFVEGDSAGGSAKQARNRETQAVLPLRGKILNVASATVEKIRENSEISDIIQALGCGSGKHFDKNSLRYEKIIIMTDADVDGAHIASLLMTFFYQEMPQLIEGNYLYLAQPPLYRLVQSNKSYYAQNDKDKERLLKELSKNKGKIEIGRFKGLGEMTAPQLKETTMDPKNRQLLRIQIAEDEISETANRVEHLMGKKPEHRFNFILEQSELYSDKIAKELDV